MFRVHGSTADVGTQHLNNTNNTSHCTSGYRVAMNFSPVFFRFFFPPLRMGLVIRWATSLSQGHSHEGGQRQTEDASPQCTEGRLNDSQKWLSLGVASESNFK